jgi:hypothetical protein
MATCRRTATNKNVSTYDSAGGKDYSALGNWEAATDNDLVTAAQSEVLECYAGAHWDYVTISGALTSASYFRIIRPAGTIGSGDWEGHAGFPPGDGSVVEFHRTSTSGNIFLLSEDYCQLQDLCLKLTTDTTSASYVIALTNDESKAIGCIAWDCDNVNTGPCYGLGAYVQANEDAYFINSIAINCKIGVYAGGGDATGSVRVYNCNTHGCDTGWKVDGTPSTIAKNCHSSGNTYDFIGSFDTAITCLFDSALTYKNAGNNNYTLAAADGNGTDLSGDSNFAFDDDILGVTRETPWDRGFSNYVPGGGKLISGRLVNDGLIGGRLI